LSYQVTILDATANEVTKPAEYHPGAVSSHRKIAIPFTPKADEEYTLRLEGVEYTASYSLRMDFISGDENTRQPVRQIEEVAKYYEGALAIGSYDDYQFAGFENTPMLFTIEVSEGYLSYQVIILDATANEVTKPTEYHPGAVSSHRKIAIPFTPQADGEYTLRLQGTEYTASYRLRMDFISGDKNTRQPVREIEEVAKYYEGTLAIGSFDEYKFAGIANTSVLLTIEVPEGYLSYQVTILDATTNEVTKPAEYHPGAVSSHRKIAIPFTPEADGEYTLRLTGTEYTAGYRLRMDQQ
ncbi:MAG: hypothetical protein HC875_11900, partial [Anaerolineales bacterium]|nr:hypothetical protein [Anaerolineales bacterium]